ncbi:Aste57867_14986 [Aphanomyces stellatus]|uniref:Meiosis regulator and mRNA stability factor 1 n=1 Tax=Aphanomyces stellatus TaxID=120398 RepID=A0A485L2C5_9STRA|nr:hypothetical protein As57867_014930 [Aphanomyces stellatus]VFT91800.1 Aste57867_14986 [Aphanomyces stellatus]
MEEPTATTSAPAAAATSAPFRSVLIIDGSYATIGARDLVLHDTYPFDLISRLVQPRGKLDHIELRGDLESLTGHALSECWFFDHEPKQKAAMNFIKSLKRAPPDGPQFQVKLYPTKGYQCRCPQCGLHFRQRVQQGVDNGIATKMLSLVYENCADRVILLAGDGDYYDTLDLIRNGRRKDLWVVGYKKSMSPNLQQLATKVFWLEDLYNHETTPAVAASFLEDEMDDVNHDHDVDVDVNVPVQAIPIADDDDENDDENDDAPLPTSAHRPHTVFVGNICYETPQLDLRAVFEHSCGSVVDVRFPTDRDTGAFRGFAFVTLGNADAMAKALQLAGREFRGRRLTIRRYVDTPPRRQVARDEEAARAGKKRRRPEASPLPPLLALDDVVMRKKPKRTAPPSGGRIEWTACKLIWVVVVVVGFDLDDVLFESKRDPTRLAPILPPIVKDAAGHDVIDLCLSD